jgi:hypothetical protein
MSAFERISSFARRQGVVVVLFGALLAAGCVLKHPPKTSTTSSTSSTSSTTSTAPGQEAWDAWYLHLRPGDGLYPGPAGIRPYVTFDMDFAFLGCNEFRLVRLSDLAFPVRVEAADGRAGSSQCTKEVLDFEARFVGVLELVDGYKVFGDELTFTAPDYCLCPSFLRFRRAPAGEVAAALIGDPWSASVPWSVSAVRDCTGKLAVLPAGREALIHFWITGPVVLEGVDVPFMGRGSGIEWTMTGEKMLTRVSGFAWEEGCVDQEWIDRTGWQVDIHGIQIVLALEAAKSVHLDGDVLTLSSDTGDPVLTARRRGTQGTGS